MNNDFLCVYSGGHIFLHPQSGHMPAYFSAFNCIFFLRLVMPNAKKVGIIIMAGRLPKKVYFRKWAKKYGRKCIRILNFLLWCGKIHDFCFAHGKSHDFFPKFFTFPEILRPVESKGFRVFRFLYANLSKF